MCPGLFEPTNSSQDRPVSPAMVLDLRTTSQTLGSAKSKTYLPAYFRLVKLLFIFVGMRSLCPRVMYPNSSQRCFDEAVGYPRSPRAFRQDCIKHFFPPLEIKIFLLLRIMKLESWKLIWTAGDTFPESFEMWPRRPLSEAQIIKSKLLCTGK